MPLSKVWVPMHLVSQNSQQLYRMLWAFPAPNFIQHKWRRWQNMDKSHKSEAKQNTQTPPPHNFLYNHFKQTGVRKQLWTLNTR